MSNPQFFHLGSGKSTSKLAEWVDDEMDLESVVCPANDGHQRAGKRLTGISMTLPGHSIEDIVWTWYSECLLTDHVLDLFKSSGFTGFQVSPVRARYRRDDAEAPRLWELVVTGWAGMASPESGIRAIEHCQACGLTYYSQWTNPEKLIVASQWDGSDFFMVWPIPRHIFVTQRVARTICTGQITGATLTALPDMRRTHASGKFSGSRLSYHMPEKRAREVGEPLGIY